MKRMIFTLCFLCYAQIATANNDDIKVLLPVVHTNTSKETCDHHQLKDIRYHDSIEVQDGFYQGLEGYVYSIANDRCYANVHKTLSNSIEYFSISTECNNLCFTHKQQ